MAKRRRRRKQSSGDELFSLLAGLAFAVIVAVVVAWLFLAVAAVLVGTAIVDAGLNIYSRLTHRETPDFRLTRGVSRFVLRPFRRYRPPPLRVETIGELLALTASGFEEAIAQSLRDRGYRDVQRRGGPGDLGVDITCIDPSGENLAVQCKRYGPGNLVGSRDVQLFIGMIHTEHRVNRGLFITTSGFTQPARALAERNGIRLMDGLDLARVLGAEGPPLPGRTPEPVFVEMDPDHLAEIERAVAAGVRLPGVRYASGDDAEVASELLEAFRQSEQPGLDAPPSLESA